MSYGDYPPLDQLKRVLVVKLRHHGDVLLSSPLFSSLQQALPNAKIDAYLYRDTHPMLDGHPAIDHFFLYDRKWKSLSLPKRMAKEFALLRQIRKKSYDLVLNLTEGDRGAVAGRVAKAPYCVGFDPGKKGFFGKRSVYSHLVKEPSGPRHAVEKNLDVLRRIGIFPSLKDRDLDFFVSPDDELAVQKLLGQHHIADDFILVHPSSRWLFKCPPVDFFAQVLEKLDTDLPIVFTSGPDQKEIAMVDEIISRVPNARMHSLAGKTSLKELGALTRKCKLLLCVDSVSLHLGSVWKTPTVVLFGPTCDKSWGPWRNPYAKVISQPFSCRPCNLDGCGGGKMSDCLYTLSPSRVVSTIEQLVSLKTEVVDGSSP